MPKFLTLACAGLILAPAVAASQDAASDGSRGEVQLSDDTIQLRYVRESDHIADASRISGTFFMSEERDIVLSADVLFPADLGYDRLQVDFGPRAYSALLEDENNDVMAVSLGAELRFELDSRTGLAVAGHAFYAPDILTFGTADNLTDLSARLEMRVQPKLTVFAGMRWFEFELVDEAVRSERTLQEELFAGVGWRF